MLFHVLRDGDHLHGVLIVVSLAEEIIEELRAFVPPVAKEFCIIGSQDQRRPIIHEFIEHTDLFDAVIKKMPGMIRRFVQSLGTIIRLLLLFTCDGIVLHAQVGTNADLMQVRLDVIFGSVETNVTADATLVHRLANALRHALRTPAGRALLALLLVVAVVSVGATLRASVPGPVRTAIGAQSLGLQFIEAFLLAEICGYWAHRAAHCVPFLWRFHRVHHSIEEMDWLAAGRLPTYVLANVGA